MTKTVLLVGATGFVGNELGYFLAKEGYNIRALVRKSPAAVPLAYPCTTYLWTDTATIPDAAVEGVDAVVNLAGEPIAGGRWTSDKKRRILSSRVKTTEAVARAVNQHNVPLVIQASAIGYYGDRGSKATTEDAEAGGGFLARTVLEWEYAAKRISEQTRTVIMRLGLVMGTTGGALKEMITPYSMGVGAPLGSGEQYVSWVHIEDVCRFVHIAIEEDNFAGPYNLTAPIPVPQKSLHEELSRYFGGWSSFHVPSFGLKVGLGEMSQLLLDSQNIIPKNPLKDGFVFKYKTIEECLRDLIGSRLPDCDIMHVRQWLPISRERIWEFFSSEQNLETITPPWLGFSVKEKSTPTIQEGTIIIYNLSLHGIPVKWKSKISMFDPMNGFKDEQLSGPYRIWDHTHTFSDLAGGTVIEDFIKYKLPFGLPGKLLGTAKVKGDVTKIFRYRQQKIAELFAI